MSFQIGSLQPIRRPMGNPEPIAVLEIGPTWKARAQWSIYKLAASLLALFRGRGVGRVAWLLGRAFGRSNFLIVRVFGRRVLRILLNDGYWLGPILLYGDYEPEIRHVLDQVLTEDCAFLDCGANVGWWSLYASTKIGARERIVAVEASPRTFARLADNARANGEAFVCVPAAVWRVSGEQLEIRSMDRRHAAASVTAACGSSDSGELLLEPVRSVTIDDLLKKHFPNSTRCLVVKLDVEGAESQALEGARSLLHMNCLLIYEDHGMVKESRNSRLIFAAGWRVFYCDESLRVRELLDLDGVRDIKRNARKGYNFFASRPGSPMVDKMTDLVQLAPSAEPLSQS